MGFRVTSCRESARKTAGRLDPAAAIGGSFSRQAPKAGGVGGAVPGGAQQLRRMPDRTPPITGQCGALEPAIQPPTHRGHAAVL